MAIVFTLLAEVLEPVLAPPLLELVLLLLEPQAATRSDSSATAAIRPMPRSARFCVRACMESRSPFVLAESKPDRWTFESRPPAASGGDSIWYVANCQQLTANKVR